MVHKEFAAGRRKQLAEFCTRIHLQFRDLSLLDLALTHSSYAYERKKDGLHNERLEFLGDAVLDLVVGEYLYVSHPFFSEGELTKARATIVCEDTLASSARRLYIGSYLLMGKGEELSGGRLRSSILADAFEAVIGAVYLDAGFPAAKDFVLQHLRQDLLQVADGLQRKDHKTQLQEVLQRKGPARILYRVTDEQGPDHDKFFAVEVECDGNVLGNGTGKSKKEAEQDAARQALEGLGG